MKHEVVVRTPQFLAGNFEEHISMQQTSTCSRHGFQSVPGSMHRIPECADVDDYNVRLFTDRFHRFRCGAEFVFTKD